MAHVTTQALITSQYKVCLSKTVMATWGDSYTHWPRRWASLPPVGMSAGFAIGNVAAFDMDNPEAVVSPGGVGFDINCGVRWVAWRSKCVRLGAIVEAALAGHAEV